LNWKFVTLKGIESKDPTSFQMDEVGNILQHSGGINPKACQLCKVKFKAKIVKSIKQQKVPSYNCEDCEFEHGNPINALDHKIETDHKVKKEIKERSVGSDNELAGILSYITKTKDDVIILCGKCNGK